MVAEQIHELQEMVRNLNTTREIESKRMEDIEASHLSVVSKLELFAKQLMDNDTAIKAVTTKAIEHVDGKIQVVEKVAGEHFDTIEKTDLPRLWGSIQQNDDRIRADVNQFSRDLKQQDLELRGQLKEFSDSIRAEIQVIKSAPLPPPGFAPDLETRVPEEETGTTSPSWSTT